MSTKLQRKKNHSIFEYMVRKRKKKEKKSGLRKARPEKSLKGKSELRL